MKDPFSYSPEEIGKLLKISRGTVYELLKRGEIPSYRVGKKIRISPADLQKYMHAAVAPMETTTANLPNSLEKMIIENQGLIICGQDIILDVLTRYLEKKNPLLRSLRSYVGSIDGLLALYKGTANISATHLWDGETGEYNIPYVRRLLPGQRMVVINLVYRNLGFYVAAGNPKDIHDWPDLLKPNITLINRDRGSGTRAMLDEQLLKLNIDARVIQGYQNEETTHIAVASTVARGLADVGLGIEKDALQVPEVDFVFLKKERYDLVLYKHDLEKSNFQTVMAILRSDEFKAEVNGMGGYDTSMMGEIVGEL
ncbi:PBP superfamily domain protein [Sporotomaculum syntrophicum]|uniref:PBP superfamily domain protein n=1 Tax=Sporotomaculum syntrophicum TaxID=182264 RepID=A0A9D3AXL1_9FIRM|nr:helix-turn-helix transcriptional regulator [Sporotomaculum syntrophicum]KAF1085167.1 PBP superfamily domain protein [Sporotomaculum syntrophicum]